MKIDSHQHFWTPARGDYHWMKGSGIAPINRPILPLELQPLLQQHGIDKTVLVQAAATVEETEYMLGLADATDFVAKVVGWVDFEIPAQRQHLERLSGHPKFAGVRPMIQDIADRDWMLRPDVQWAYQAIVELDLTFDALGFPLHLENFLELFRRFPTMRSVIDHCMKPAIRDNAFPEWARAMKTIARETTACCKLSGLASEAGKGWNVETLRPYAEHVIDVFGPARVMWGSDWPVLNLNGSYGAWYEAAGNYLMSEAEKREVFGGTAARFYRIG